MANFIFCAVSEVALREKRFSSLHFPTFGLNTDQKISEYGHFLGSVVFRKYFVIKNTNLLWMLSEDTSVNIDKK